MASRFQSEDFLRWERAQLERARTGDARAWQALHGAFASALQNEILLPRLGIAAAAEEALAETFRLAFERLSTFDGRVSLFFWLARIATHCAIDQQRQRQRRGKALAGYAGLLGPLMEAPADPATEVERLRDHARLRAAIDAALGRIPPRYRRAIELRILEERPRAACAEALEVSIPTFDVVLLRALRAFREAWSTSDPLQAGEP